LKIKCRVYYDYIFRLVTIWTNVPGIGLFEKYDSVIEVNKQI